MSYTLAPVTVTAGQTISAYVGTPTTVGAVVVLNESPYALSGSAGSGSKWIVAQTGDILPCNSSAFSGTITLTASTYLTNSNQAPSFLVYLTTFAPGEAIPGTYPCPLPRMLNVGNTVMANSATTTMEQDLFTPFVLSGFLASKDGSTANQLDVTAGIAYPKQSDGSLLRTALTASTFLTSAPSATYFLDLNPDGSWSFGTSHSTQTNYIAIATATTDASGNITTTTNAYLGTNVQLLQGLTQELVIPSPLALLSGLNLGAALGAAASQINSQPSGVQYTTPQTGAARSHAFFAWDGATLQAPFGVGVVSGVNIAAWVDYAGVLHATAPVTLAAGHQETGACGYDFIATAAGQSVGYVVNFKTTLTNVPTSITLTPSTSANITGASATQITRNGFLFTISSTAAGQSFWIGTYTTVGN